MEAMTLSDASCPMTGSSGKLLRQREPEELLNSYIKYFGLTLPEAIRRKYFTQRISEYESRFSGLRWYTPALLGDGEYYAALASMIPGYYNPGSWDKVVAIGIISSLHPGLVVEVGCGDGWLLLELAKKGIAGLGVEINADAVAAARKVGLPVYLPDELAEDSRADVLCLLQTIEHVNDPIAFVKRYVERFKPRFLLMSAPCHEGILGHLSDPLSWPPHHATAWSQKAFQTLAESIGFHLVTVEYTPLSYQEFEGRLRAEGGRKLPGMPYVPANRLGRSFFNLCHHLGVSWARRGHSIAVLLEAN